MIKFLEGFDSYGAVSFQSSYKWDNANVVTLAPGRFSGFSASLLTEILTKSITPASGMTVGFSLLLTVGGTFLSCFDSLDNPIMDIGINLINNLVYVNSTTTAYSSKPVPLNTWVYFEVSIQDFTSTAAGNILIRLNGDEIFSSPSGFVLTGSGLGKGFTLFGGGASDATGYDDFYICDNLGTYNTGFIEDGEILTLFPNGPGDETDFGVVGAATNWEAVSEQPFDGDTSYVFSGTTGDQDLYTVDTITVGNTFVIPGIMVNAVARYDNIDPIGWTALIKSGVNLGAATSISLTSSYLSYQAIFEREPVTDNAWTETLVNAMQIGSEVG